MDAGRALAMKRFTCDKCAHVERVETLERPCGFCGGTMKVVDADHRDALLEEMQAWSERVLREGGVEPPASLPEVMGEYVAAVFHMRKREANWSNIARRGLCPTCFRTACPWFAGVPCPHDGHPVPPGLRVMLLERLGIPDATD